MSRRSSRPDPEIGTSPGKVVRRKQTRTKVGSQAEEGVGEVLEVVVMEEEGSKEKEGYIGCVAREMHLRCLKARRNVPDKTRNSNRC